MAPVDPVIVAFLLGKSSQSVVCPVNTECRMLEEGGKLAIRDKSSAPSADFLARAHASGNKGFLDMIHSVMFGGWESLVLNAESLWATASQYAAARKGGKTNISHGSWGDDTLVLSVDDGGLGGRGVTPQLCSAGFGLPDESPARNRELRRYR